MKLKQNWLLEPNEPMWKKCWINGDSIRTVLWKQKKTDIAFTGNFVQVLAAMLKNYRSQLGRVVSLSRSISDEIEVTTCNRSNWVTQTHTQHGTTMHNKRCSLWFPLRSLCNLNAIPSRATDCLTLDRPSRHQTQVDSRPSKLVTRQLKLGSTSINFDRLRVCHRLHCLPTDSSYTDSHNYWFLHKLLCCDVIAETRIWPRVRLHVIHSATLVNLSPPPLSHLTSRGRVQVPNVAYSIRRPIACNILYDCFIFIIVHSL